ncbi:hypothetical protein H5T51_06465 [Candidatus Bathyarchaeota archaeon]|nr:hypothetical protein [Candidatus Bathyarchaeota archaeon]
MSKAIDDKEKRWLLAASIFYAITGLICLAILAMDYRLVHMALIGVFSIASALFLFKRKKLALWFIVPLFFTATTFSASLIYYGIGIYMSSAITAAAYLILTWIFTFYVVAKRGLLKG